MKKKIAVIVAAVALAGMTACDPEEQALWDRIVSEHEAAQQDAQPVQPVQAVRVQAMPVVVDVQKYTSWEYSATISCDPITLHLANTGSAPFDYLVGYGAHQTPLVMGEVSERHPHSGPPVLDPGASVVIDLTPAAGERAMGFFDRGLAFTIDVDGC